MKRFFLRLLILFLPAILLAVVFLSLDPIRIVKNYDNPLIKGPLINDRVFQARYLEKNEYNYNAFILGSSRAKSFHTDEWNKYLKNIEPFHMAVNDETIYGIEKKLQFLLKQGYQVNELFIALDHRILSRYESMESHLFRDPPQYTNEKAASFYKRFVIAFLKPEFLKSYYNFYFLEKKDGKMMFNVDFRYNKKTGDHIYWEYEELLEKSEDEFYEKYKDVFYERKNISKYNPEEIIETESLEILNSIGNLIDSLNINCKVVINPGYDQKKLHNNDLMKLEEVFGESNVFDYSGINNISNNYRNYYEYKHYRPFIGDKILKEVYAPNSKN